MKNTKKLASKTAIITIKTDPETKQAFQRQASLLDMPLSTMLVGSGWQTVRQGSITFEPVEYMTPKLERTLAKIERDIKLGKNPIVATTSTPEEIDALFADIRAGKYDD